MIGLTACQESYYYNETRTLNKTGWTSDDIIDFPFNIVDTTQLYHLYFDLEHTTDFEHQNLYIKIDTKYPDEHILSDTLSFDLANKLGDWNGKCSGTSCDLRVFLANNIRFEQEGDYKISFSPFSRVKEIKYINEVSMKLKEVVKQ